MFLEKFISLINFFDFRSVAISRTNPTISYSTSMINPKTHATFARKPSKNSTDLSILKFLICINLSMQFFTFNITTHILELLLKRWGFLWNNLSLFLHWKEEATFCSNISLVKHKFALYKLEVILTQLKISIL